MSQPIFGAAVMCRPAHGRPVLPFGPSANNCLSEHIHRIILSNVAVTRERHRGKYMSLILAKGFILNICHCFVILSIFNYESHFGIKENISKNIQYFIS